MEIRWLRILYLFIYFFFAFYLVYLLAFLAVLVFHFSLGHLGVDNPETVVDKLMTGLNSYQQIKSADAIVERERLERFVFYILITI